MPDPLEFPRMRCAIIPLMRAGNAIISKLVARRFPGFPAIVGALDHLPEPTAGLRGVDSIGIDGRTFEMVDFPSAKVGTGDIPMFTVGV